MATFLTILVALAFLALSGGVAYLWLRLNETARREALQALAARRGWALTISEEKLGRPGFLRLTPRGGPTWTVETRRARTSERPGPTAAGLVTEFNAEEPRWPEGQLIIGPPLPEGTAAHDLPRSLLDSDGRALITATLGPAFLRDAENLTLWPSPPAITVYCSTAPVPRFDLGDLSKLYATYCADARQRPVIAFTPEGLRLHLPEGLSRADQMERFIDLALEAARIL